MKAFVEILAGIVRVGPQADHYECDYEFSVAFSADGNVATIKGLVRDREDNLKLTPAHYRAGVLALKNLGLTVKRKRVRKRIHRARD